MSKRIKNPACLTYWTFSTVYYDKRILLIRQPVALAKLDHYGPPSDSLDLVDSVVKTTSSEVWVLIIDMHQAIEKVMASMADDKAEVDCLYEVERPRKSRPANTADGNVEDDFSREVDVRFAVLLRIG